MTFPEIKLVAAPTSSATLLFDFNDTAATPSREVLADDFSIGTPDLIGDVDAIDPLYGERVVTFTCRMSGTKAQVAAAQSSLSRRLLAPGQGWLQVRMTPASPLLFFRTYRPSPGDLSFDLIQTTSTTKVEQWEIDISIPCEPLAYGERVTNPVQTVRNDPTLGPGLNPMQMVLPPVKGDGPTMLRFRVTANSGNGVRDWLVVSHAHTDTAARGQLTLAAIGTSDGATAGTDTSAPTTVSGAIGGTGRTVSFSTNAGMATRLTGSSTVQFPPGRYRALLRANLNSDRVRARLSLYDVVSEVTAQGAGFTWIDFGNFELPPGRPEWPEDQGPDVLSATYTLGLERLSGTQSISLDHLLIVPQALVSTIEARAFKVSDRRFYSSSIEGVWDGDTEDVWLRSSSDQALYLPAGMPPQASGPWLRGIPGATQVLTVFTTATNDAPYSQESMDLAPTATTSWTVAYYPRYLYLPGA